MNRNLRRREGLKPWLKRAVKVKDSYPFPHEYFGTKPLIIEWTSISPVHRVATQKTDTHFNAKNNKAYFFISLLFSTFQYPHEQYTWGMNVTELGVAITGSN